MLRRIVMAGTLSLLLALAGCAGGSSPAATTAPAGGGGDAYGSSASQPASGGDALKTATTPLGDIVVDGRGMTVYMYDADTQGTKASACTGACLSAWPLVTTDAAAPRLTGVTGTVGTIATADGGRQVTLNGWPLYYYAGDGKAGDTTGQGVGGVWWVLTPAGERVTGKG
jgi:predicted lipoprotein with Yx(FWY)xxD motif